MSKLSFCGFVLLSIKCSAKFNFSWKQNQEQEEKHIEQFS